MAKREKRDREYKTRDYVVYFIVAFVLIFLTSSFVIEDVYNNADKLSINPAGVQAIYESTIGKTPFVDQEDGGATQPTTTTPTTTVQ